MDPITLCGTCPYWDRRSDWEGHCRRRAPRPAVDIPDNESIAMPYWPVTTTDDWCGEHPDFAAYLAARKEAAHGE